MINLIDKEDETVIGMFAYAKNELAENQNNPVIILQSARMPNGDWLFKKLQVRAVGGGINFPGLKDNAEYDFFDFKPLSVEVQQAKQVAN